MVAGILVRSARFRSASTAFRASLAPQSCRSCMQYQAQFRPFRAYSSNSSPATPSGEPDIYDVVCVGGGPAGLSLLAALRANPTTANLRVALVEAQDLSKLRSWSMPIDQFSNRCSSLTPASAAYLDHIGAWAHLKRDRVQEYQEMQVWDGVSNARIEFDWAGSATHGSQTIAYMAENLNLTQGLLSRIDQLGGVSVFDGTKVAGITFGEKTDTADLSQWPVVHLSSGKALWARLLVGADGANSPVRTFADIETRGWDYNRHGVVATLQLEGDGWGGADRKVAYQRFLPTGPMALLPLPGHLATLVWSTTPERAAFLKALAPRDFVALVNAGFRLRPVDIDYMHTISTAGAQEDELTWRLQHTTIDDQFTVPQTVVGVQEGSVASFPLKLRHADTYIGERVALVGDAAHSVHPLAGQGLNQGQGDIQSLVRTIETTVLHGQDIGSVLSLEAYNAERYAANHVLMGVCDKLHKLYSFSSGPIVPLRSAGLAAVNALRPLKNFFMEKASGGSGAKML